MSFSQITSATSASPWREAAAPEQESAEALPASGLQAARRQRFTSMVRRVMLALIAFTLLGFGRFVWQRQELAAEFKTAVVTSTAGRGPEPAQPTPAIAATGPSLAPAPVPVPRSEPAATGKPKPKGKLATKPAARRTSVFLTGARPTVVTR